MSDQEHIDVTSMDDTEESAPNTPSSKCKYCGCEKEGLPVFHCDSCEKWVHTSCLHSGSPSPILFDNYYIFKCVSCSDDGKESFVRMRLTWNQVTSLALFNIAQQSPGKQGFFKWKEVVGSFVDKHWDLLFESYRKKSSNWMNSIAATLSLGNPHQFTSGYGFFKESGWWKLTDPTAAPEFKPGVQETKYVKNRKTKFSALQGSSPGTGKVEGLRKRSYLSSALNASQLKEKRSRTQKSTKKHSPEKDKNNENAPALSDDSPPSFKGCTSPISSPLSSPRSLSVTSMLSKGDMVPDNTLPLAILSDDSDIEQESKPKSKSSTPDNLFSPLPIDLSAMSTPCPSPPVLEEDRRVSDGKDAQTNRGLSVTLVPQIEAPAFDKHLLCIVNFETVLQLLPLLFSYEPYFSILPDEDSTSLSNGKSAFSLVKRKKKESSEEKNPGQSDASDSDQIFLPSAPEMSLYEERALLKKLESYGDLLKEVPEAWRLRRKLLVRQRKRELNVPITSFDATFRQLLAKEKSVSLPPDAENPFNVRFLSGLVPFSSLPVVSSPHHRILDRFQSPGFRLTAETQSRKTFRQKLVGSDGNESFQSIVSPYTQRILKPFIRRDYETKPAKLAVLEEIVSRYNKCHCNSNVPVSPAPIDFSYVRPYHIPTVNALCHHFFWPGIDLSESLQYPDFSIVALYKKMVIGFGFMVPDVNFNEAYISFVLVHPDWQHAGIGKFIIYHLIQTCMGKEVTLHVSASNPAMLLYQKFGFKPEKFIVDFYDKYQAVDSTECSHAFFMRLRR